MKKVALVLIPLILLAAIFARRTDVGSYARLGWKNFKQDVKEQIPPEKEIERLRDDLSRLDRLTDKHISAIAEEMILIEEQKAKVVRLQTQVATKREVVLALKAKVETGDAYVIHGDLRLSQEAAKDKLAREFSMYKSLERELAAEEQMLVAREESLANAREQLEAMRDTKKQLQVELCQLEAELKAIRVAQTRSKFQLDDSELARIKEGIAKVRHRVQVEQKTLELRGEYDGTSGLVNKDKNSDDVLKQIDEHFNTGTTKVVEKK